MTDSLKIYETLKSVLPEAHASIVAKAIGTAIDDNELHWANELVPKVDVVKFDAEMHLVETSLTQRIDGLEAKMESKFESQTMKLMAELGKLESKLMAEMEKLDAKLMGEMARLESRLEAKIANSKTDMIRWMFIFWIGQIAAMKFLK